MMNHRNGLVLATIVAACLLSVPGCWRQQAAQQAAAARVAEARARAEFEVATQAAATAARVKGSADANRDIANGILKQKEYPPLPAPAWHQKYIALLKERCDVEWEVVQAPPGAGDTLREEVIGYNEVMRVEIERRCGAGILGKLNEEAQGQ